MNEDHLNGKVEQMSLTAHPGFLEAFQCLSCEKPEALYLKVGKEIVDHVRRIGKDKRGMLQGNDIYEEVVTAVVCADLAKIQSPTRTILWAHQLRMVNSSTGPRVDIALLTELGGQKPALMPWSFFEFGKDGSDKKPQVCGYAAHVFSLLKEASQKSVIIGVEVYLSLGSEKVSMISKIKVYAFCLLPKRKLGVTKLAEWAFGDSDSESLKTADALAKVCVGKNLYVNKQIDSKSMKYIDLLNVNFADILI